MNSQAKREIRFGLIALALSGLSFLLGAGLRGPVDLADPSSLVRGAASGTYVAAWTIILAGGVLQLYGFFGLYRYLTYRTSSWIAFLAFVLSTLGIALFLPLAAFLAVSGPVIANLYQQGNQGVIAVVAAQFTSGLGLALLGVEGVAYIIGAILFAIAIWRHGAAQMDRRPRGARCAAGRRSRQLRKRIVGSGDSVDWRERDRLERVARVEVRPRQYGRMRSGISFGVGPRTRSCGVKVRHLHCRNRSSPEGA